MRQSKSKLKKALEERLKTKTFHSEDMPFSCPECIKKVEQLRVAHVTIKYLQRQIVTMASKLVPKLWPEDYDLPG